MDYESYLWLKLVAVAVGVFLYRFIVALRGPEPRDKESAQRRR
jgi:hypothetical protein